jgi:hypothetical protein
MLVLVDLSESIRQDKPRLQVQNALAYSGKEHAQTFRERR